jgi:hypothetical protein
MSVDGAHGERFMLMGEASRLPHWDVELLVLIGASDVLLMIHTSSSSGHPTTLRGSRRSSRQKSLKYAARPPRL